MKYYLLSFSIILLLGVNTISAQHDIEGHVMDENNIPLIGVTVILLEQSDSSMMAFSITNEKGDFRLEDVEKGDYLVQLSYISFQTTYISLITNWNDRKIDIGNQALKVYNELLKEITIEADRIPLGVRGDTLTYNTGAFKTREGATVEDLLKRLPGIEVARDGSIKAQGKEVENVLVDGKEFFGKDPKIATQNLDAEAIDKVQVFDKASEIAEFTGIDDGQKEKTINLKLKEDYKSGGFGKVAVHGGTEDRYLGKLNYNRFNTSMQASTIISGNNINKQAFTFNEYINMMGGLSNAISNTNGSFNFGEFGSNLQPEGIFDDLSAGMNFNNDCSSKVDLKSHYFYIRSDLNVTRNQLANRFTPTESYTSTSNTTDNNLGQNHRLNTKLKYKPTPFLHLILKNNITGILNHDASIGTTEYESSTGKSRNSSEVDHNSKQWGYNGSIQVRKKYQKKGRNWISNIQYKNANIRQTNDILNEFELINNSVIQDQFQLYESHEETFKLDSRYTEPLGKRKYLGLNYSYEGDNESPLKTFYSRSLDQLQLIDDLSGQFEKKNKRHRLGASFKYNGRKFKSTLGLMHQWSTIDSRILGIEPALSNMDRAFIPSVQMSYEFGSYSSGNFNYSTRVNLPSLSQLLPIPNNSDPNLLIVGNPSLIPEYQHDLSLNYSVFDNFNFTNFYIYTRVSIINNKIINSVSIDENLLRTIAPINSNKFASGSINMSYGAPIRPLKIKYSLNTQVNFNTYESLLNNEASNVSENNLELRFTLENRKKKNFDLLAGITYNLSTRNYDINQDFNQTFTNYAMFIDASIELGKGWSLASTFDWNSYSNESFSQDQNYNLWNASLRKSLSNQKIALEIKAYDLLGQNIGLKRGGGINTLYETRFNTLTRYVTFGMSYKLGRNKKKSSIQLG